MDLSVVVHTRNSAKTLRAALESVMFAKEIIIIDAQSQDETIKIAGDFTDKIFTVERVEYVEPVRNFGIAKANNEWVLILDADEEVPPTLAAKLPELTSQERVDVWRLPRKNLIFGLWPKYAAWWPDYVVRLFRRGHVEWLPEIHSQPQTQGVVADVEAREELAILHHNYVDVSEYLNRLNHYTSIAAAEKNRPTQPALEAFFGDFFRKFFVMKSYKDGLAGLHLSLLQAMYEAAVSIKQWEAGGKKDSPLLVGKQLDKIIRDLAYWRADYQVQTQINPLRKVYWRIRRKIRV